MKKVKITIPKGESKHFEDALESNKIAAYSIDNDGTSAHISFSVSEIVHLIRIGESFAQNKARLD